MDVYDVLVARGFVQQVTDAEALRAALSSRKLTFYVGFDPTSDSLHIGNLVPILAMTWLQRAGHHAIAVMGGGTAMVGDPSGKTEMRQMLTVERIDANARAMKAQLERFLALDGVAGRMVDNAEWLRTLNYIDFLRDIGVHFSVNRMLSAEAYKLRLEKGLSFIEFNYQLLQAYDYLELAKRYDCCLQLGGDDQWGNILAGTDLVRRLLRRDVFALTQPLITTATGAKMGKTERGAVYLDPNRVAPFDFYQYWLNVDDRDVGRFLKLYTFLPLEQIAELERLEGASIREAKRVLAREMTTLVHGKEASDQAERAAAAMVSAAASEDMPAHAVAADEKLVVLIADAGLAKSRGEARRLIEGGGVRLDGERVDDVDAVVPVSSLGNGRVVRVGKKRAVRLVAG